MQGFRTERDSLGTIQVPGHVYYGAQTQRAVDNFPLSGRPLHPGLIHALGLVKVACATVNHDLGKLTGSGPRPLSRRRASALIQAAREVAEGKLDAEFPVDVFQTGSGTSSNMNCNEVIANRAIEIDGGNRFSDHKPIHPHDHVNMGQSTNDVFPTAIHVAVARSIRDGLVPALSGLEEALREKAGAWEAIVKIGRTHLADATPLRLGQEFGGMARGIALAGERAGRAMEAVLELPVGGTAVGTGLNTHPEFGARVTAVLAEETGIPFLEAADHLEANARRDGLVECHGQLRAIAVTLFHVADSIRWLGSGPRCGIHEIVIPELQPGSSIMPGKGNPVLCEAVMQVAARVMGNDACLGLGGAAGGHFQLNVMMPVMAQATLESVTLMERATRVFAEKCVKGLEADAATAGAAVERSLALVTGLVPLIGYDRAAELAKEALATGRTIREICRERGVLPREDLEAALDPLRLTRPGSRPPRP